MSKSNVISIRRPHSAAVVAMSKDAALIEDIALAEMEHSKAWRTLESALPAQLIPLLGALTWAEIGVEVQHERVTGRIPRKLRHRIDAAKDAHIIAARETRAAGVAPTDAA